MKNLLYILFLSAVSFTFAWDDPPRGPLSLPTCPTIDCMFTDDVLSGIESGSNYYIRVSGRAGLLLDNPSQMENGLQVVLVQENGDHLKRFLSMQPGERRVINAKEFEGASEVVVISLQRFEAATQTRSGSFSMLDVVPPVFPDLVPVSVMDDKGKVVTVGIDEDNLVHILVYGQAIGSYDGGNWITLDNGREIEILRR